MLKAEFLQTAAQVADQTRELFDVGVRTNLLQSLVEQGHPYGLLLGQSSGSSESLLNFFFPPEKGQTKAGLINNKNWPLVFSSDISSPFSIWPSIKQLIKEPTLKPFWLTVLGSSSSVNSSNASRVNNNDNLIQRSLTRSLTKDGKSQDISQGVGITLFLKSLLGLSVQSNVDLARKLHWENLFHQAFLAPIFLKLFTGEKTSLERPRELQVAKNSVSLGTTAIKLATYQGEQPFVVKSPQGEPIAQINPGDQLGHLHVSHQASFMRGLSVIEKTRQITGDFIDLLKIITTGEANLKTEQQDVLAKAQTATLIGISHLVPLFRLKTGLPTWKLDVLPELIQRFHQHDSQAVSTAFGGTRKVKPTDVEMMVVTPAMRQQLVAAV